MKDKPKIGFYIPKLGITDRGAEVFVFELAKRLRRDFEVTIWVRKSKKKSKMISELKSKGVLIIPINPISSDSWIANVFYRSEAFKKHLDKFQLNPDGIEGLFFSLASLPQTLRADLDILFPVSGFWGALICRFVRFVKGTPFVYASQGGIQPLIAKQNPNIYFTINPVIKHWLDKHFPKLKVVFISNGVDLKKFSPTGKKAKINLSHPIFLTVAALVRSKRVDLTIKAVGKLKTGSLMVIGDGPLKGELTKLGNEHLGKKRFKNVQANHDEVPNYYRAADVFVFSAPKEVGWSIVHLEALATGLPIAGHNQESLVFLMGKYGILCDTKNAGDYAKAIKKATKGLGINPRKLVKNYSWDVISKKYKKELLSIIDGET